MKESEMNIPHLFRCPISLDLITDPVTLSTGQTYDRASIQKWLAAGNRTCPITMQKLHDLTLLPNHTLRHVIHQWLCFNQHCVEMDSDLLLAALKHDLESDQASSDSMLRAIERVEELVDNKSKGHHYRLIQLGFPQALIESFLAREACSLEFAERAASCAVKLMPFGKIETNTLSNNTSGVLSSFLALFERGRTARMKTDLCHILESISSSSETLCEILGSSDELLRTLILLTKQKYDAAIKAVLAICSSDSNRENLVREGAMDPLINYIGGDRGTEQGSAAAAMEMLLQVGQGKRDLIGSRNGVKVLVKMVYRVSEDHKGMESAINGLIMVCRDSPEAREKAIGGGVLTQLLLLLQSQCSSSNKIRARALLKILNSTWVKENH